MDQILLIDILVPLFILVAIIDAYRTNRRYNKLHDEIEASFTALSPKPCTHATLRFGGREEVSGVYRTIGVCDSCGKAYTIIEQK